MSDIGNVKDSLIVNVDRRWAFLRLPLELDSAAVVHLGFLAILRRRGDGLGR